MSVVTDFLFGGDDTSAQKGTQKLQSEQLALFKELSEQARGDVIPLFGQADIDRTRGFEAAFGALQEGQPQFQNTILGLPAPQTSGAAQTLDTPFRSSPFQSFGRPDGGQIAGSLPFQSFGSQQGGSPGQIAGALPFQSFGRQQTAFPQFGGTGAVFPEQQVGFTPPARSEPIPSGLTLADAQRAVFAADKGTAARDTAQAQVNQLLASGAGTSPLSQALTEFQGLTKGTSARGRAKQEVKDLLAQGSLQNALSGFFNQFTDGGTDPTSVDNVDLSTMSDAELSLGLSISKGLSNVPTFGIISMFSQAAINSEISKRGGISTGGVGPGSGFGGGEDEAGQVDQGLA